MLRITIKEEPTDQLIKKQEKRKSRLRVVPVEEPPKSRLIEFKYHGEIETLPTDYQFKVKFVPQPITSDGLDAAEPKSSSGGGGGGGGRGAGNSNKAVAKAKSRSSKKAKAVIAKQIKSQPVINLPQPRFRVLKQATVYKKPANALGPYRRKGVNTDDDNDEIIKVVNPTRRGKKKRGRKKKEVVIIVKREEYVEYDMDEEDAIWLDSINKQRRADRLAAVDKNQFEKLIDRLEKESFKLSQHSGNSGPAIDEDAVCCICNDGECQNSNAILFCDMCNLAVHQECYGVPYIPEGQWLCRRCLQSPTRAVDCVLCPNKGGAFKHTDDNRWAHVICALWIPEVCFANTVFLEPIDSICAIPPARWKLVCCVCHKKNVGACIQCHKSNCYVAFHVTCAQQAGLYMKIEAVKEMTPQGINTTVRKLAYCINHAPASKSGSSNGLYSSGDESKEDKNDPKMKEKMKKARKLLADKLSSGIPVVNIPVIPNEVLVDMASGLTFPRRNQFLLRLHSYWKLKRQSRNGAPLLRRLQSNKSTIRFDQLLANRNEKGKRERKKIDNYVAKLVHIRYNLERSRMLLNQIIRRERSKFLVVENNRRIQIMRLQPFNQFLFAILDRVVEKDTNKFFCEPVSIEHVPDYLSYIQEPMDLGTMRQKVEQCQYRSFDAFQRDLELIISNCKTYNTPTTIWHKAAIKLELFINELLDRYRPLARNYDQETGIHLPSIHSPQISHSTD